MLDQASSSADCRFAPITRSEVVTMSCAEDQAAKLWATSSHTNSVEHPLTLMPACHVHANLLSRDVVLDRRDLSRESQ
jgi:hypothetical protein